MTGFLFPFVTSNAMKRLKKWGYFTFGCRECYLLMGSNFGQLSFIA